MIPFHFRRSAHDLLRLPIAAPATRGLHTAGWAACATLALSGLSRGTDAVATDMVNIIDGKMDIDQNGSSNTSDDASKVLLFFDNGAILLNRKNVLDQVDISSGQIDVNESGTVTGSDDMADVWLIVPTY